MEIIELIIVSIVSGLAVDPDQRVLLCCFYHTRKAQERQV